MIPRKITGLRVVVTVSTAGSGQRAAGSKKATECPVASQMFRMLPTAVFSAIITLAGLDRSFFGAG